VHTAILKEIDLNVVALVALRAAILMTIDASLPRSLSALNVLLLYLDLRLLLRLYLCANQIGSLSCRIRPIALLSRHPTTLLLP
jgi:hypothetical protein